MSNLKRDQKLVEFRESLCPIMDMNCGMCVCKECPRDCSDCSNDDIEVGDADCLFMCIDRRGVNRYKGYNDEEDGWMNWIDLTKE
jgi:hypothetical protein